MLPTAALPPAVRRDRRVDAFVKSGRHGPSAVARFLPPETDPDYLFVLNELVRADVDHFRSLGIDADWDAYRAEFPGLSADAAPSSTIPPPTQVVDLARTPPPVGSLHTAATAVREVPPAGGSAVTDRFPAVGTDFHGFTLVEELGRGAFGRVYLARERRLADRPVALKVTTKPNNESQRLAQLQHTNIVPILTAFQAGPHHAVQMPFFGRQTLADLIDHVRGMNQFPRVGGEVFTSTVCRLSTARRSGSAAAGVGGHTPPPGTLRALPPPADHPLRAQFAKKSYTDAVLWVMTRLADGLAHAHARDILHLDLKPHNVLMADDGQPMLLDFNLSFDVKNRDRDRVGGTWPYMAPEQIEEYAGVEGRKVDARTDLYGLGVIFFELLTLRHPFPPVRPGADGLREAVAARMQGPPTVRDFNPTITPAVEAVVRKLLAPDPAARYQSAADLLADLQRHQEHLPLRHAPDRSVRERAAKWQRRHPNAAPYAATVVAAAVLLGGGVMYANHAREQDRLFAVGRAGEFRTALATLRVDLADTADPAARGAGLKAATDWLARYGVGERPDWTADPAVRPLPAADRAALRRAAGEAALLAAHAEWVGGRNRDGDERAAAARRAVKWNAAAEAVFGRDEAPAVLWDQRRELAAVLGDESLIAAVPDGVADRDPADLFVSATRFFADGRYEEAIERLVALTEREPEHFAGQYLLGCCYRQRGENVRAEERFRVAAPLAPKDPRPAYNCGLVLLAVNKPGEAEKAFTAALVRDPGFGPAAWHRGLARRRTNNYPGAVADLTAALDKGAPQIPVLVARADVYDRLGDAAAAARDRAAADAQEPRTEVEFSARGVRWVAADPARAVADFDRAAKLNPDYLIAWQNKAHVLADRLHEAELALEAMDRAVEIAPQFGPARAGRAVLLARLGRRDEAHKEARRATLQADDPGTLYKAANVFAITSGTHPEDRETALGYLRRAFLSGYRRVAELQADPDMANVRGTAEYREIVRAIQALVK